MLNPPVNPYDAPFDTVAIPTGWLRPMTQAEADEANALYPVPPYGQTYIDPGESPYGPPTNPLTRFVILSNAVQAGPALNHTRLTVRPADIPFLTTGTIFTFWPIAGVLGIVDDVGVRPARVVTSGDQPNTITIDYDIQGLDVTGLILVGVIYIGPTS